jgi:hypothetical protein
MPESIALCIELQSDQHVFQDWDDVIKTQSLVMSQQRPNDKSLLGNIHALGIDVFSQIVCQGRKSRRGSRGRT